MTASNFSNDMVGASTSPGDRSLRLEVDTASQSSVVHFGSSLKFAQANEFRQLLSSISASGARHVVFELSGVKTVDSAGLGMFIIAQETANRDGWSLTLRGAQGHVKMLIEISRLDQIINIKHG